MLIFYWDRAIFNLLIFTLLSKHKPFYHLNMLLLHTILENVVGLMTDIFLTSFNNILVTEFKKQNLKLSRKITTLNRNFEMLKVAAAMKSMTT